MIADNKDNAEEWISVSDMMAGLMMIFLFVAVIYIQNISKYFDEVNDTSQLICNDLRAEFTAEAQAWNMSICEDGLLIRFVNDTNFETNSAVLSLRFKYILNNFFPRFMEIIHSYNDSLSELRIEGHTDSSVRRIDTEFSGYLYNTKLSQERSRSVMSFVLNIPDVRSNDSYLSWCYENLTAHGMSSSNPILNVKGKEDYNLSRRVEFRLRTKAEDVLMDLVKELNSDGA